MPTSRMYYSHDSGAPILNNAAGSLIALLDAVLVTGYGAKAGLGWSKTFTGTNQAAYTQGAGSNGFKLAVDDTNVGYALVRGYEAMTAVTTGTLPFPTVVQQALAAYCWHKSDVALNRPWVIWGDERGFRIAIDTTGVVNSTGMCMFHFGDVYSEAVVDPYCTLISASLVSTVTVGNGSLAFSKNSSISGTVGNWSVARLQNGSSAALPCAIGGDQLKGGGYFGGPGGGAMPYPNPRNGGAYLAPIFAWSANDLIGRVPGTWEICHAKPFAHLDTFDGVGAYAGKSFVAINLATASTAGQLAVETSNTWS